jgi:hypothetical protein
MVSAKVPLKYPRANLSARPISDPKFVIRFAPARFEKTTAERRFSSNRSKKIASNRFLPLN